MTAVSARTQVSVQALKKGEAPEYVPRMGEGGK